MSVADSLAQRARAYRDGYRSGLLVGLVVTSGGFLVVALVAWLLR